MKKQNIILKLIICSFIITIIVYYLNNIANASNQNKIITVSQENVAPEKNFYLIMNLSAIQFNKFQVEITNSQKLISEETTGEVSKLASSGVATTFIIDKNINTLEKMGIVYNSPKEEGSVNFNVKITSLDVTIEDLNKELGGLVTIIEGYEKTLQDLITNMELEEDKNSEVYVKAIEQKEELEELIKNKKTEKENLNEKIQNFVPETLIDSANVNVTNIAKESSDIDFDKNNKDEKENTISNKDFEKFKEKQQGEMDSMNEKMGLLEKSLRTANDTISSLSVGTKYQGSSNNYISSLSVTGFELDKEFNKTVNDYFINVSSNVTKVSVNVTKEDSSAVVAICGNTELKKGQNKILISVTAQNGDVRYYRIYVNKEG